MVSTGYIANIEVLRATAAATRWRLAFKTVLTKTWTGPSFVVAIAPSLAPPRATPASAAVAARLAEATPRPCKGPNDARHISIKIQDQDKAHMMTTS